MINNLLKIISEAEVFQLVLFFILLTLIFVQIVFQIIFLVKIVLNKEPGKEAVKIPLSVLMTIRNEEENLADNLPRLLEFENADYEVVVVDDFSQDSSLSVLGKLKDTSPKLRVSVLNQETRFSTKLSQNIALKSAKNDWVLFVPSSIKQVQPGWMENLSGAVPAGSDIVINYSNVLRNGGFFNKLYRIETFLLYLKSMRYAMAGFPFVYFENNVLFRKEKYFERGGYGKKIKEPYANLELLINQFISKKKCRFNLNNQTAIRFSEIIFRHDFLDLVKKSFRIEQHLSYPKRALMFAYSAMQLSVLPFSVVVMVLFTGVWQLVLFGIGLFLILRLLIIKTMQNHLNERKIFITSLVYELIMPYYKIVLRWHFNRKSRKQKWKSKV